VLFSGGGENYHASLPVTRGRRPTAHFWFDCAARDPRAEL
jgi:predicted 2-oxoglutarate/Fe(II)-dependent dioxygenase YbiX